MIVNYICLGAALLLFVVSLIAVFSEYRPSHKAKSRNLFRRLRITLREFRGMPAVVTVIVLGIVLLNINGTDNILTLAAVLLLIGTAAVLSVDLLTGRKRSKKRKRVLPRAKMTKNITIAGNCPTSAALPELTPMTEKEK